MHCNLLKTGYRANAVGCKDDIDLVKGWTRSPISQKDDIDSMKGFFLCFGKVNFSHEEQRVLNYK